MIKAILDNVFSGKSKEQGIYYTYEQLFVKFAENYWNLVVKYHLCQMRKDGKSEYSKIEKIFQEATTENPLLSILEFASIEEGKRTSIIKLVVQECKKNVIGALYNDFDGTIYSFDLKESGLTLNPCVYEFILKYKYELEKINYYSWARMLEQINNDDVLIRVINKLELSTPRRDNLSVYREILRKEFEENTCFYCGKKLQKSIHVDHFIPWSFVKDDKIWNLVLSCAECNERKNSKIPVKNYLVKIENRNKKVQTINNVIVQSDFSGYSNDLLDRMWHYAKLSGMKEYIVDSN